MGYKILKEVDDFRLLEFPSLLPDPNIKKFYEIVMGHHVWRNKQVQLEWVIIRVVLHENEKYALNVAQDIFNHLTKTY